MTIAVILVVVAFLALAFLLRMAKGQSLTGRRSGPGPNELRRVDLEAFRNLMDPAEREFLREALSSREFRMIQRERMRAALDYISCAARNAAILVRAGDAARHSTDPSVAEAGEKLMNSAINLRLLALQAMAKVYWGILFPGLHPSPTSVADSYERVTGLVFALGRVQSPARGTSAAL